MSSDTSMVECRAVVRQDGAVLAEGYDPRFRLATARQSIRLTRLERTTYPERLEVELLFYPSKLADDERQELERLRKIVGVMDPGE